MEFAHVGVAAGIIVAAIGAISFWVALTEKISKATSSAEAAAAAAILAQTEARAAQSALADFKEKVARDYVSHEAMRQMEDRLVGAIDRLANRLDELFIPRSPLSRTRAGDVNT